MTNPHDPATCKQCRAMRHPANHGRRRVLAHFPRQVRQTPKEGR